MILRQKPSIEGQQKRCRVSSQLYYMVYERIVDRPTNIVFYLYRYDFQFSIHNKRIDCKFLFFKSKLYMIVFPLCTVTNVSATLIGAYRKVG